MAKKKKISELPLVQSLVGLYTIGVDAANDSVKVSLEWLKTAYDNVISAISKADTAARAANTAAIVANKAAEDAGAEMTRISQEVSQAITETNTAKEAANTAALNAQTAADNVQDGADGKTPVLESVAVTSGATPSGSFSEDGTDEQGNPRYSLNLTLPKGENGQPPLFEPGTTTTGEPGTEASAEVIANGFTPEGNPKYLLNFTVPRGMKGNDGTGSGNVYTDSAGLITGKKYLFVPEADGSTVGTFAEYIAPAIPTKNSELVNDSSFITKVVNNLTNYYLKSETYTKTEVLNLIAAISTVRIQKVDQLPAIGESNVIYFVPKIGSDNDVYDEYVYIDGQPEHIGKTQIDLSDYLKSTDAESIYQKQVEGKELSSNDYTTAEKEKLYSIQWGAQVNPGVATESANGLMSAEDKKVLDRQESYTTTTTVAALNADYKYIYVTLNSNASLSVNVTGTGYNGRSITAYVYCSAARTIAIPTTGSYVSMCGNSYTCPVGKWVEFNLECIAGVWHIAKLEQE